MTSEKGELDANGDQHVEVLASAAAAGCDLAVFPEMSLTGSVDPVRHPDRAVALDDRAVDRVVHATRDTGVDALFGIGERGDGIHHIAQVHAAHGRIMAVQRKRVLGEDEEGFDVVAATERFTCGPVPFGVIICAEAHDDRTWNATAATGAALIALPAAPGLDGRRTDEAGWREGHEWWWGAGVGDAARNAARLGVWVAIATQAGATADEDFPGGAALIDPTGVVRAQLPGWRPGTLVVDVPIDLDGRGSPVATS